MGCHPKNGTWALNEARAKVEIGCEDVDWVLALRRLHHGAQTPLRSPPKGREREGELLRLGGKAEALIRDLGRHSSTAWEIPAPFSGSIGIHGNVRTADGRLLRRVSYVG